jgi:hypothetical protein
MIYEVKIPLPYAMLHDWTEQIIYVQFVGMLLGQSPLPRTMLHGWGG